MESESVVSLRERRGGTDKPDFVQAPVPNLDRVELADMFLADGSIMADPRAAARAASATRTAKAAVSRIKRVLKELKKFAAGKGVCSGVHVFPDASTPVDRWKVLLEGPAGSPFEGGVFVLNVEFPSNYPFSAPKITFETPVYHCNTNKAGRICLELLHSGWSAATNVSKCLEAIKEMLKNPDKDSPLRDDILKETEAHRSSGGTDTRYVDKAKALTSKEAALSVADWETKWSVKSSASIQAGITKATALSRSTTVPKAPAAPSRPAPVSTPTVAMKVVSMQDVVGKARGSSSRSKRVLKELKQVASGDASVWMHEGKGIHIFPDANDFSSRWKVLLEGPAGSPFDGGVFVLNVDIPSNYPFGAPKINFETPVYHCNASAAGRLCLELLHSGWSPTLTLPKAIEAVQILLKTPDTDNALRSWIAEETIALRNSAGTETQYLDAAKKLTKEKASVSVEDWKKKWGILKSG